MTETTTENNTNKEGNTMTEKKYEIFTFKGTLTKCRFESGYMGKGDKAWRISLKLDKPLTAEIKDNILSILKIDKNDRFCPKWLKENDKLFKKIKMVHDYPHCWRCKSPLIYFAKPAWYVKTTAYKDKIIEETKKINWYPDYVGTKRYGNWLENMIGWGIARNRY